MKRKLWILFLGFVLFLVPLGRMTQAGQSKPAEQSKLDAQIAKIKTAISKRVAGDKTRVELKLTSGVESKGRLNQAGTDDFTFTDEKTGNLTLAYADVERVKGRGLSTGAKIGIIVGVAAVVVVVIGLVSFHHLDPFENGIVLR